MRETGIKTGKNLQLPKLRIAAAFLAEAGGKASSGCYLRNAANDPK